MRSVVLSGLMGTGKTTIGALLARDLDVPFVDTDSEIERATGRRVAELWHAEGEAAFRARETELVTRIFADRGAKVVAFGGGTVTTRAARRMAIDRALVVTLTASPETITKRVHDVAARPNLAVGSDPVARARELLDQRADFYAECHLSLSTDEFEPEAAAARIIEYLQRDPLLVPLGKRSYRIEVCADQPSHLEAAVTSCVPSSTVVVTDANVLAARSEAILAICSSIARNGKVVGPVVLTPGEQNKTLVAVSTIWDAALAAKVDRQALVLAFGGGVVGDLAGFAAACLLRGVRFLQVPTTLLSMVDSSVGGKTGCDHPEGKNLIGAFHQPSAVVADIEHLSTLSERQYVAGLSEIVKIALATDAALLGELERHAGDLTRRDPASLLPIVRAAIDAKVKVVRDDEREAGPRALLNLGHTIGHALEAAAGYGGLLHGEAVALGTAAELRATARLGWTPVDLVHRATTLLSALGLPTQVEPAVIRSAWSFVASDKKRARDTIRLPVVEGAGLARVRPVGLEDLCAALEGAV